MVILLFLSFKISSYSLVKYDVPLEGGMPILFHARARVALLGPSFSRLLRVEFWW